jgi:two-component system, NarL family, sensor histidine kinase UhpB
MVERLGRAEAQNRRLHEQLVTVQEEERAELARDLHDEVGPFLFCVTIDVAAIEQAVRAGRHGEVPVNTAAIRKAVGHMQVHVRAMLERLRPPSPVELGLVLSLRNLVTFWQARRPAIAFTLRITEEEELDETTKEVAYRVVQEGMTNAVRHGHPGRIEVVIEPSGDDEMLVRVADDGVGLNGSGVPGFGLTALRDRVHAKGGTFEVRDGPGGRGLEVMARLPRRVPADAAEFLLPP